jgi:hypothetical protein
MVDVRTVRPRMLLALVLALALLAAVAALAVSGCGPAGGRKGGGDGQMLYPLMIKGKYAYVDRTGQVVIPRQFVDANPFQYGVALVSVEDGKGATKFIYINKTGKEITPYAGHQTFEFTEGLGVFMRSNNTFGFVDTEGRVAISGPFAWVERFEDGLAAVSRASDGLWGVIDTKGDWVVPAQYRKVLSFSEGLCAVETAAGLWGFVDAAGRMVIAPRFTNPPAASFDLAPPVSYRDQTGFNEGYYADQMFVDGVAPEHADAGFGFIDTTGAWVIPPQFEWVTPFSDGLAAAKSGGKWGYIDRSGTWAVAARFEWAGAFQGGLAVAKSAGLFGIVDRTGAWVAPATYKTMLPFSEGLAAVQAADSGLWGYVDTSGKVVIPVKWTSAKSFTDGLAIVRAGSNTDVLIDHAGTQLTE